MAEIDLEKNGKKIFHYESKKNKDYKGKKFHRHYGISKFVFNLLWTGLWLVFVMCMCYSFETMKPLWLLILWFFGYKW